MSRRLSAALTLAGSLLSLTAAADLSEKWRSWRYSRTVEQPSVDDMTPAEIVLPWDVLARSGVDCADLRVIDGTGLEVPYELAADKTATRTESRGARVIENSFVPGKYTQVVGDFGEHAPFYDHVRIETSETDFIVWAEVALSDDARTWRVVEPHAPIARFRKRAVDGTQTIPFHGLNSRYVRVRIFETDRQFAVSGLMLHEDSHPARLVAIPATFSPAKSDDASESAWTTDLGSWKVPVSQVRFTTDTPEFYRVVLVSESADGKEWNPRGSGTIYRYKQENETRESLTIDVREWQQSQLLRVEVINGNDRPLSSVQLSLAGAPRRILFRYQPGMSYRVLYGNERASAPQYDLRHYLESGPTKPVYRQLALGTEQSTGNYRDPRPFTERHPELLWLALGIAILLIGFTAIRTLRSPAKPGAA